MKSHEFLSPNLRQIQQLKFLISQGEGATLEFKRKATFPEKIIREMIAFANTKGGILLIGIGDDGSLAGLKYPEEELHVMTEALKKVTPYLQHNITLVPIAQSRTVIQYEIPESKRKPHYLVDEGNIKASFVRVDDKSIKASRELREIVKREQRMKDIRFHFGEHEKFLMQYLDEKKVITLKEFIALSGLKRLYASRKLILLVLANVLKIIPHEKGDLYVVR
ncbi:MAG TPA: ATP-binding protein [Chryseolinea sp.]|jgi:predicted HTH transcriptional regulator|nr:ATP-binding protein [Chryseolinea sp.]